MSLAFRSMVLAAVTLLGASACSSEESSAPGTDAQQVDENGQPLPAGSVDCSSDPRLEGDVGVDTMGELGVLSFRLEQVAPAPPARGTNSFQLHIQDVNGTPMVGELRVNPRMPDHGHGSPVRPNVVGGAGGEYTIEQLVFFMAGVWRIELEARSDDGTLDRKSFFFCVEG